MRIIVIEVEWMESVLCICISTYNRVDKLEILLREILKVESLQLSICVVDDGSSDETANLLSKIRDERVSYVINKDNKGARENWYETINHGKGKYLLHLLDRDWIRVEHLEKIIDLFSKETCGFGYVGSFFELPKNKRKIIERYSAGEEALKEFSVLGIHPSGFFVRKELWDALEDKNKFFREGKYGIYPHCYIFDLLATKYDGLIIRIPFVEIINKASYIRYKSKFYHNSKEKSSMWWLPSAKLQELKNKTTFLYKELELKDRQIKWILQKCFMEGIICATIQYRDISKDYWNAEHYGVDVRYITENELIRSNLYFTWNYIFYISVKCPRLIEPKFLSRLVYIGIKNLKEIVFYK